MLVEFGVNNKVCFGSFHINKVMSPMTASDRSEKKSVAGPISRLVIRTLQCIFAIVVAVLYGLDLQHATDHNARAGSAWIYAELVAGISMTICMMDLLFTTAAWYWCLLDGLVFILWVTQFGTFASIYLGTGDLGEDQGFERLVSGGRMRAAVWVNLCVAVIGKSHN
ncbi:hypothetical protein DER46DRAFT_668355 [Fusarium sp. MPI-SDFR-AT-0072]|nr:hypothetical protein DER46DRAFT_668355 [Fusarium sp. MPI-SDFR-AT-0072]